MKISKRLILTLAMLALAFSALAAHGQLAPAKPNSVQSLPFSDTHANKEVPGPMSQVPSQGAMVKGQRSKIKDESDPTPKPEVRNIIAACAAAVDELAASRELVDALEKENEALRSRLETEKQLTELLTELNNTRKSEADALRAAVTAKSDALDAKDAVIASQDKLIKALEKKKSSPWRRLGDVLIGAAVIAVMK